MLRRLKDAARHLLYGRCGWQPTVEVAHPTPWDYVQKEVELNLHRYLATESAAIQSIIIVGAHEAYEVDRMLSTFPKAEFLIFEPSTRYFQSLCQRFQNQRRVTCFEKALTDSVGQATFYETSLVGSGSLLRHAPAAERDYGLKSAETFDVETTTLDQFLSQSQEGNMDTDLLWCDVQGAELQVLRGATRMLGRCSAVFLEVAVWERTYVGAALWPEITAFLAAYGFVPCLLGVGASNGTGICV